jgi:hypothetical protein
MRVISRQKTITKVCTPLRARADTSAAAVAARWLRALPPSSAVAGALVEAAGAAVASAAVGADGRAAADEEAAAQRRMATRVEAKRTRSPFGSASAHGTAGREHSTVVGYNLAS